MHDKIYINLCCGPIRLKNWVNIDYINSSDICLDLEKDLIPFPDNSVDGLACISAINYFTFERGQEIIRDAFRVLRPGGIARFGVQDLRVLSAHYLNNNTTFWNQRLPSGQIRFPGKTLAQKFNAFFTGFSVGQGHNCKVIYDYETLEIFFRDAGFDQVEELAYRVSRLPDIELLDNRPEQMFFLEAVKEHEAAAFDPAAALRRADALLADNRHLAAWQELLSIARFTPHMRGGMTRLVETCIEHEEFGYAVTTVERHSAAGGKTMRRMLPSLALKRKEKERNILAPADLACLDARENRILSDFEHAQGCIEWLVQARSASKDGGVSSVYYPLRKAWGLSYPETTGYIIATLLAWSALTRDVRIGELAVALGDWELDIQSPCGGAGEPVGLVVSNPRSFNTGQVLLGWMALFEATGEPRFIRAAERAGQWLIGNVDGQGRFVRNVYQGPHSYKARVAWALFELAAMTGDRKYARCATRITDWTLEQATESGWFRNISLTDDLQRPWTHLISYTLVGLVQIAHLAPEGCDVDYIVKVLRKAALAISRAQEERSGLRMPGAPLPAQPGTYDPDWKSADQWSCLTGNAQSAFFLYRLDPYVAEDLKAPCREIITDLKRVHYMDGIDDPDLRGGLAGSWPLGGGYCAWTLPNWGPKFFADALLLFLNPTVSPRFTG
ncbi:MAG: methyltransferase domain-containing protein [Desulfovibrio sp.]|jgi:predicted SAM-dependent methyltransferase/rhamnogalacturonyl hydrolase YesR|nr:methyltransferase domain-containing protein [Desulfovibrio sp.]